MNIPTSTADLTPEFLSSALQTALPGAHVERCHLEPQIGKQGISSAVRRLHLVGRPHGLPTTVMVKLPPTDPVAHAQLHAMRFFAREVGFYQTLAEQAPLATPHCYAAEFDPATGAAFLLLEDLGSAHNGDTLAGCTVTEVAAVLATLARLHARWWEDRAVVEQPWLRLPSMVAPSAVTDVFEQAWPPFLDKLGIPVDDDLLAIKDWISGTLHRAATTLFETGPRTLVHNDVQADNVFFSDEPDRSLILLDWQLTAYARGVVDVASAVRGSLDLDVRRRVEADLLRGYHDALVEAGVQSYPIDQCRADYELATVLAPARLATAVGLHGGLHAHPGAAWDTLFPRFAAR